MKLVLTALTLVAALSSFGFEERTEQIKIWYYDLNGSEKTEFVVNSNLVTTLVAEVEQEFGLRCTFRPKSKTWAIWRYPYNHHYKYDCITSDSAPMVMTVKLGIDSNYLMKLGGFELEAQ